MKLAQHTFSQIDILLNDNYLFCFCFFPPFVQSHFRECRFYFPKILLSESFCKARVKDHLAKTLVCHSIKHQRKYLTFKKTPKQTQLEDLIARISARPGPYIRGFESLFLKLKFLDSNSVPSPPQGSVHESPHK